MRTHNAMRQLLVLLLVVSLVHSALVAKAPSASELDGVHILIDNDVDTNTNHTSMMLLSKRRNYQDSIKACESLGESVLTRTDVTFCHEVASPGTNSCLPSQYGYSANSTAASNLALSTLLKMTLVAEAEVRSSGRYWIRDSNTPQNSSDCSSIDRNGKVSKTWCSNLHPTICSNSAPRRKVSQADPEGDTSRQIKVPTNNLGTLQGHRDSTAFRFYGIPYAEPPVGTNRFAAPKPLKNRDNGMVLDANKFGHACIQLSSPNVTYDNMFLGAQQSEDCLYLNVFTPTLKSNTTKGIPVMVYIHGGSYTSFSGTSPIFEPGNLVSRGGVVVVTLNYRLSIFGLFQNQPAIPKSAAPGNLPTRDQIAALQWVQKNIATFGGDPDQVTIFGESAGGWSIRALLSAPSAFGLYKNAISQSDPIGLPFSGPEFAAEISNRTLENLGCASANLTCAQNKTADQVRHAQVKAMEDVIKLPGNQWVLADGMYRPCVDGSLIPANFDELVQQSKYDIRANILWGWTKDEYRFFIPALLPNPVPVTANMTQALINLQGDTARHEKLISSSYYQFNSSDNDTVRDQFARALTDLYWACPYQKLSRKVAQSGKLHTYRFDRGRSAMSAFGMNDNSFCSGRVCHSDDIVPMFGSGDIGVAQTGDDARFSRQIIDRVATFARTGDPNPRKGSKGAAANNGDVTGSRWTAYVGGSNDVMKLNLNSTMSKDMDKPWCDWIEENVKYDYELYGPGKQKISTNTTSPVIGTPSAVPSARPSSTPTVTTSSVSRGRRS